MSVKDAKRIDAAIISDLNVAAIAQKHCIIHDAAVAANPDTAAAVEFQCAAP